MDLNDIKLSGCDNKDQRDLSQKYGIMLPCCGHDGPFDAFSVKRMASIDSSKSFTSMKGLDTNKAGDAGAYDKIGSVYFAGVEVS